MSAISVSLMVLGCVLGGAILGSVLRAALPRHHLTDESRDAIKLGIGLISTLVALVLGLLVASAKGSFDARSEEIRFAATKVILLDRELRRLGPEGQPIRSLMRRAVAFRVDQQWGEEVVRSLGRSNGQVPTIEDVQDRIRSVTPSSDGQRQVLVQALLLCGELAQTRWLLVEQVGSTISFPFLVVVVTWLTVIFASLGLLAPNNKTVRVVILLCAISVSTAVLLILELDRPFRGLITLSKEPLQIALNRLDQGP